VKTYDVAREAGVQYSEASANSDYLSLQAERGRGHSLLQNRPVKVSASPIAQSTITMAARPIQGGEVWACSSGYSGKLKTKARHWRRAIANILEVIE
jgi:hypothetical protein